MTSKLKENLFKNKSIFGLIGLCIVISIISPRF